MFWACRSSLTCPHCHSGHAATATGRRCRARKRGDDSEACQSEAVPESGPPILGDDKPPVRVVDLDWHSTLVVLASFVGLITLTGAIRAAPHAISILIVGSLLALA